MIKRAEAMTRTNSHLGMACGFSSFGLIRNFNAIDKDITTITTSDKMIQSIDV